MSGDYCYFVAAAIQSTRQPSDVDLSYQLLLQDDFRIAPCWYQIQCKLMTNELSEDHPDINLTIGPAKGNLFGRFHKVHDVQKDKTLSFQTFGELKEIFSQYK